MIPDSTLEKLGFNRIMTDYWRKDDFSVIRSWTVSPGSLIHFNTVITTVEELKEEYKKKTGKELSL